MNFPVLESFENCIQPLTDSGFTGIDFLTAADKTNDNRPILVAINAGDQEFWFGLIEAGAVLFPRHKIRRLFQRPSALRLIKQDDMLWWCAFIRQAIISKVMDVLDKGRNLLACIPFSDGNSINRGALNSVSCQGFPQNGH